MRQGAIEQMGMVLQVVVYILCGAFAIACTVMAGPVLSGRIGRHSLWVAPLVAAAGVQVSAVVLGLYAAWSIGGRDYLARSLEVGMAMAPYAALAGLLSAGLGLLVRGRVLRYERSHGRK